MTTREAGVDYTNLLCNLGPESSNVPRPWEGPYIDETEIAVGNSSDWHRFVWEASKNNTFVADCSATMSKFIVLF